MVKDRFRWFLNLLGAMVYKVPSDPHPIPNGTKRVKCGNTKGGKTWAVWVEGIVDGEMSDFERTRIGFEERDDCAKGASATLDAGETNEEPHPEGLPGSIFTISLSGLFGTFKMYRTFFEDLWEGSADSLSVLRFEKETSMLDPESPLVAVFFRATSVGWDFAGIFSGVFIKFDVAEELFVVEGWDPLVQPILSLILLNN